MSILVTAGLVLFQRFVVDPRYSRIGLLLLPTLVATVSVFFFFFFFVVDPRYSRIDPKHVRSTRRFFVFFFFNRHKADPFLGLLSKPLINLWRRADLLLDPIDAFFVR